MKNITKIFISLLYLVNFGRIKEEDICCQRDVNTPLDLYCI